MRAVRDERSVMTRDYNHVARAGNTRGHLSDDVTLRGQAGSRSGSKGLILYCRLLIGLRVSALFVTECAELFVGVSSRFIG